MAGGGDVVGVREAAEILGLSETTVWGLMRGGRLPYAQPGGPGGKRLIRRAALAALLRPAAPAPSETAGRRRKRAAEARQRLWARFGRA